MADPRTVKERTMDEDDKDNTVESPTNSQKTISDDDEIDYTVKPEFYDSDLDGKNETWMYKKRGGRTSDAVLSCPGCFTTVCFECQRHERYVTQYRAIFVKNCKIEKKYTPQRSTKPKRGKRRRDSSEIEGSPDSGETVMSVLCLTCSTEIGVFDSDEVYHFFNVIPSES